MIAFISSPKSGAFHIGPLVVHAYGLMYIIAVTAAIAITIRRWEQRGGERSLVYEVAKWGFPAGLIGGRLYFLATSWNEVPNHWWGPLAIWNGGLGIWGGIAAGTLAGLLVLRRRGVDVAAFLDAAAPALLVGQAIGRVGNYFNQELFGGPTTLPWGLRIDASHRPLAYARSETFHPTFLYELLWNLSLAGLLVWLGHRRKVRTPGLFALYVTGYSLGRIGEELLRVDPANHILGMRLNFWVASTLFLLGLVWFAHTQGGLDRLTRSHQRAGVLVLVLVGAAASACGCGHGLPTSAHGGRVTVPRDSTARSRPIHRVHALPRTGRRVLRTSGRDGPTQPLDLWRLA